MDVKGSEPGREKRLMPTDPEVLNPLFLGSLIKENVRSLICLFELTLFKGTLDRTCGTQAITTA